LTKRGKAVQSLLRWAGLDDLQRTYLDLQNELEAARADIKALNEAENLYEQYLQLDFWVRIGSEPPEIDTEQLLNEARQANEDLFGTKRPDRGDDPDLDVLVTRETSLNPKGPGTRLMRRTAGKSNSETALKRLHRTHTSAISHFAPNCWYGLDPLNVTRSPDSAQFGQKG